MKSFRVIPRTIFRRQLQRYLVNVIVIGDEICTSSDGGLTEGVSYSRTVQVTRGCSCMGLVSWVGQKSNLGLLTF